MSRQTLLYDVLDHKKMYDDIHRLVLTPSTFDTERFRLYYFIREDWNSVEGGFGYVFGTYQTLCYMQEENVEIGGFMFYNVDENGNERILLQSVSVPPSSKWYIGDENDNKAGVTLNDLSTLFDEDIDYPELRIDFD